MFVRLGQPAFTNVVRPGEAIVPPIRAVDDVPVPPEFVGGPVTDINLTVDVLMTPVDLSVYFTGAVLYSLTEDVVKNLTFNVKTGVLSGTPIFVGTGKYRVRGHNVDGLAVSNIFNIAVSA